MKLCVGVVSTFFLCAPVAVAQGVTVELRDAQTWGLTDGELRVAAGAAGAASLPARIGVAADGAARLVLRASAPEAGTFHVSFSAEHGTGALATLSAGGAFSAAGASAATALDPGSAKFVDAYLARLTAGFRNALVNARPDGEVDAKADLDDLAAFLAMSVVGISALLRAKATPEQMHAASRGVVSVLGP